MGIAAVTIIIVQNGRRLQISAVFVKVLGIGVIGINF